MKPAPKTAEEEWLQNGSLGDRVGSFVPIAVMVFAKPHVIK